MSVILILLGLFCLLFYIARPKKPNGITLYFANIGTGKTTFLAKHARAEMKRMNKGKSRYKDIISNARIEGVRHVPDIRKLLMAGAVQDTLILIDEASIEYNNRKQNLKDVEIAFFKLIRHYNCTAIVVSQSYNDIDVTLRRLYSEIYLLNYLPYFTLIRPIKKSVGIDEMTNDIVDKYKFKSFFSWRLFFRPKYFKYFNSWWIPSDIHINDLSDFELAPKKEMIKKHFIKADKLKDLLKF